MDADADLKLLQKEAVRLLALREFSRQELKKRLHRYWVAQQHKAGIEIAEESQSEITAAIAEVLSKLEGRGLQNDQRAATQIVDSRMRRYGSARIAQTLKSRGIEAEAIKVNLQDLSASEHQRARLVLQKRFSEPPKDAKEFARQLRFLCYRGFAMDVAMTVLKQHKAGFFAASEGEVAYE